MKKIIVGLFILTVFIAITNQEEQILIPEESIRFRVIANSDSKDDQNIKIEVKEAVEKELNRLMMQANNISSAREIIKSDLSNIEEIVKSFPVESKINFGNNYFPEKEYKGITYQEGDYESLVITLGKGLGQNWWCVMFPPLCLLEAKENEIDNVEYQFFVKEMIEKYM